MTKNKRAEIAELPKVGQPALRALHSIGLMSLNALTKVTEKEIAELHGIGPKALAILKEAMRKNGLSFKQEG